MTLTAEQIEQRKRGVSASEVAAICGMSSYQGAWSIWAMKRGLIAGMEDTDATVLGHLIEPVVAAMYLRRNPTVTLETSATLTHPTETWAMATPDRVVTSPEGERWLLECKSGGPHASFEWGKDDGDDAAPIAYMVQCQWQAYVTGLDRVDLAGYVGGRLVFKRIDRHEGIVAALVAKCRHFYEVNMVQDVEPDLDALDSTTSALESLYGEVKSPLRDATDDESALVGEYLAARDRAKLATKEKDRLANELRACIGEAEGFRGAAGKATWRAPNGVTTRWQEVAEALKAPAALIAKHSTPLGRRLDVRAAKEKE